ncbi:c-type cytochrome [Lentisphaera marina]|uniref:c-type cytochrome n=1 Tax=Lentisphaera marina TaxID=1111041 RepID=UPI002366BCD9|nr:c-type cytochrome [Lentisphaera marina]MDD7985215.1 c-type cytochrome [Lentisphaera marina]
MKHTIKTLCSLIFVIGLTNNSLAQRSATPPERISLPKGFEIDLLYSVPSAQGSWVAMCKDDKGRLIVSDQYGGLYRLPVPQAGQKLDPSQVEQITYSPARKLKEGELDKRTEAQKKLPQIGHAQGLCYAFNSLYVVVNGRNSPTGSGVFRLRDSDGDDKFDKIDVIRKLSSSGGEHGPHGIIKAPDDKHLYVVMGNQTSLPPGYSHSRVPKLWGEDQLWPPIEHFMVGAKAPLGHLAQIDPEGKNWDVIATGFRNQYDIDVNREGEVFTFDADMEWDLNTPWYRPTRVNHIIDGADYGWRNGTAKFMDYCSDTFGAVVDIGPGSPTGVKFGYGAKFPAKYQNALYISDWSYGKLYAVHMTPNGSTYSASFEEFASAQPLPLTDLLIHPDGHMYITIGGRRVQSGLYRIRYTGNESTAPVKAITGGEQARAERKKLEAFLQAGAPAASADEIKTIWKGLGSTDRGIRHAARAALEKQDPIHWKNDIKTEKNPQIVLAAMIALARKDKNSSAEILTQTMRFDYKSLNKQQRLDLLRAVTLAMTRGGKPNEELSNKLIAHLDSIYPALTTEENRDLSAIVGFLQAPYAAKTGIELLLDAPGQEEQIGYALNLRHVKVGWTPQLRKKYFEWFVLASTYSGGARFKNYLGDIKKHALASIPKDELSPELNATINAKAKQSAPKFSLKPRNFVKNYTSEDLKKLAGNGIESGRNFKNGRQMFGAGSCFACHRFNSEGGAVGPDLTSVRGKFSAYDLLEAVVDPGKEISDQYGASIFTLKDGSKITGRIMNMTHPNYSINTNMMTPSANTKVHVDKIESIEKSPISMMPPGLVNTMAKEDIQDLLAYLLSGGDPEHKFFKK